MAKTTVSKPSKNSSKNISLKVPQLATKTKTIEPDVSCNSTGSSCMEAAKTTVGKKRKNSTKSTPEISSHGTWSPYMDGIVGTPKSVAEIVRLWTAIGLEMSLDLLFRWQWIMEMMSISSGYKTMHCLCSSNFAFREGRGGGPELEIEGQIV
ncbi:hypothetical protein OIU76_024875 [Salix suchowensis]|nr:hypothetical protein OIU76_024875 [Salix suchowensis]